MKYVACNAGGMVGIQSPLGTLQAMGRKYLFLLMKLTGMYEYTTEVSLLFFARCVRMFAYG